MSDETRVYIVINPSDPITFRARPDEAARIAVMLEQSWLFAKDAETGENPASSFADSLADSDRVLFSDDRREGYADAWASFLIGSPEDRALFEAAVSKMTAEDGSAYRAEWHERRRTSMNDICARAWEIAAKIRAERPVQQ